MSDCEVVGDVGNGRCGFATDGVGQMMDWETGDEADVTVGGWRTGKNEVERRIENPNDVADEKNVGEDCPRRTGKRTVEAWNGFENVNVAEKMGDGGDWWDMGK